ncbi:MAG: hypothetical protein IKL99_04685 [Oscillospiraceae bacterium]|nr:hypothetical protein [Oscillospiraceae bacterium]
MKIYNKNRFALGIFWIFITIVLLFGAWERDLLKLVVSVGLAAKCFYSALSESGNAEQRRQDKHYVEAATALYGRHYAWRTNLPLVVLLPVYAVALVLRFAFEIWLPAWFYVAHLMAATAAVFYSIGLERSISEYIGKNFPLEVSEEEKKDWDPER